MGTMSHVLFRGVREGGDAERSTYPSAKQLLVAVAGLDHASCIMINSSILWVAKTVEADVSKVILERGR